jgi:hypothetical protein
MSDLSEFCTCKDLKCPLHPTKHDQGCTLCISKNRKAREIPSCFFRRLEHEDPPRKSDTFQDFARLVLSHPDDPNDSSR